MKCYRSVIHREYSWKQLGSRSGQANSKQIFFSYGSAAIEYCVGLLHQEAHVLICKTNKKAFILCRVSGRAESTLMGFPPVLAGSPGSNLLSSEPSTVLFGTKRMISKGLDMTNITNHSPSLGNGALMKKAIGSPEG